MKDKRAIEAMYHMGKPLRERLEWWLQFTEDEPELAAMFRLSWEELNAARQRASSIERTRPDGKPDKAVQRLCRDIHKLTDHILIEAYAVERNESRERVRRFAHNLRRVEEEAA